MTRQCYQCKKVFVKDQWVYPRFQHLEGDVTQVVCEDCMEKQLKPVSATRTGDSENWKKWLTHFFDSKCGFFR